MIPFIPDTTLINAPQCPRFDHTNPNPPSLCPYCQSEQCENTGTLVAYRCGFDIVAPSGTKWVECERKATCYEREIAALRDCIKNPPLKLGPEDEPEWQDELEKAKAALAQIALLAGGKEGA